MLIQVPEWDDDLGNSEVDTDDADDETLAKVCIALNKECDWLRERADRLNVAITAAGLNSIDGVWERERGLLPVAIEVVNREQAVAWFEKVLAEFDQAEKPLAAAQGKSP